MIATIDDLRSRALGYAVVLLCFLAPLVAVLGYVLGTGGLIEAGLLALIAGIVMVEKARKGPVLSVQMAASAGLAIGVSTLVYLMRGHPWQADSHMIFFAAFALTAVFCDWRPIVTYAAIIAVHHLVLNFTLTAAVFPGEASFGRVLLHAVVLVVQAVPLIWLTTVLARMFTDTDMLVTRAHEAQQEAANYSETLSTDQATLRQVVDSLRGGLQDLAAGNLRRPLTESFAAEHDELRLDFNKALHKLSDTISQVMDVSESIHGRSAEISTASEDLSRRTENQAAALEQTAAALDELTASIKSAATGARDVEGIVQQARREAESNGAVVRAAVAAMSEIERSSQQISQIIGAIDDIAFQTNLLALNAGVEAARAGDAGRGFAVVASEVRALAQRSSSAAKEIKTLIATSEGHVGRGVDQVGKAGQALHSVFGSITEISTLVSGIAAGASEQASGLAEINIGINQLDQVTQQNAAMVEQSTAASQMMKEDAKGLAEIVRTFEVNAAGSHAHASGMAAEFRSVQRQGSADSSARHVDRAPVRPKKAAGGGGSASWQDF